MYKWRAEMDNCPFQDLVDEDLGLYVTIYYQFEDSDIPDYLIYKDIKLKPETQDELVAYKELKKIQDHVTEFVRKGLNLFLCGSCGTGKSSWGIKILKQYIYDNPELENPTVVYASVPKILENFMVNRFSKDFLKYLDKIKTCPLLLLDDIAFTKMSPDFSMVMYNIVQYRLDNGLSTIYTSNACGQMNAGQPNEVSDLYRILDNPLLYSRIWNSCRDCHKIILHGRDRRGDK